MRTNKLRLCSFSMLLGLLLFLLAGCGEQQTTSGAGGSGNIVINHKFNSVQVHAHQLGQVSATCAAGQQIVSGGFATTAPNSVTQVKYPLNTRVITASYPSSTTTWTVQMLNREGADVALFVHIYCIASTNTTLTSTSGLPDRSAVVATCGSGTTVSGGGFQITNILEGNDVVNVLSSVPVFSDLHKWQVSAQVGRGSQSSNNGIIAYAVCTAFGVIASPGNLVTVKAASAAPAQTTIGQGSVSCAATQVLLSAGFTITSNIDGNAVPIASFSGYTDTPPSWSFSLASLPNASIEGGALNEGAEAILTPLCGTIPG